jgi:hypothetical protein
LGSVTRIAVVGDIGGQYEVFREVIIQLGGNPSKGRLPRGLLVIQVGDLVRISDSKDLNSTACIELADRMLRKSGGQWIQLIGNHDAALLGGPRMPGWSNEISVSDSSLRLLSEWWSDKRVSLAVALKDRLLGPMLISHAGVTRPNWLKRGGKSASATARSINRLVGSNLRRTSQPGKLINNVVNRDSDVMWAEVNEELYTSWIGHHVPFSQIHGHDAPWDWMSNSFLPNTSSEIRVRCLVDEQNRRTVTFLGQKGSKRPEKPVAISVDWKLGTQNWPYIWKILTLDAHMVRYLRVRLNVPTAPPAPRPSSASGTTGSPAAAAKPRPRSSSPAPSWSSSGTWPPPGTPTSATATIRPEPATTRRSRTTSGRSKRCSATRHPYPLTRPDHRARPGSAHAPIYGR